MANNTRVAARRRLGRAMALIGWFFGVLALSIGATPALALAKSAAAPDRSTPPTDRTTPRGRADATTTTVNDAVALSYGIRACLEREDPACAAPLLKRLEQQATGILSLRYGRGYRAFLLGDFKRATTLLQQVATSPLAPARLKQQSKQLAQTAAATAAATATFSRHPVAHGRFIIWLHPGADEVLLPLLDTVLSRAAKALTQRLGPLPKTPIAVHIYPQVETLAAVSGLTVTQVRTSGTIALCKHNRLMITSPRDLFFGYHWADTIAHELVHFLVIKRGGPNVPVWLHEALARTLEGTWRDAGPLQLDDDERAILRRARRKHRLVRLRKMHPTMAALPSQEAAQTAFAEVHHALIWLRNHARKGDDSAHFGGLLDAINRGEKPLAAVRRWSGRRRFPADWWAALRRGVPANSGVQINNAEQKPSSAKRKSGARGRRQRLRFRRTARRTGERLGQAAAHFVELGDRLLAIDRPLAAVMEYRKALAAGAKDDALMLTHLARGLLQLKRFIEAKVVLDDALSRHRQHAPLLLLMAQAAAALGDNDGALYWAGEMLWINPYDPAVHDLRAKVLTAQGQTAAATAARLQAARVR